jgi:hypothetical protein
MAFSLVVGSFIAIVIVILILNVAGVIGYNMIVTEDPANKGVL